MPAHCTEIQLGERRRTVRWILFLTFFHTLPSPWMFVVAAGLAPAAALFAAGLFGTVWLSETSVSAALFFLAPALVYGAVYFGLAHVLAVLVGRVRNRRLRMLTVALPVAVLLGTSFMPIYVTGGHSGSSNGSIFDLWQKFGLSPLWLQVYLAALGAVLLVWMIFLYCDVPTPRLSSLWRRRSGKISLLLVGAGLLGGFLYLNHVLLLCRPLGELGVAAAQACMGRALQEQRNALWGIDNARIWLERAAAQGNAEAALALSRMAQNSEHRARWLTIAAEAGDGEAGYTLYRLLRRRPEIAGQSEQTAAQWLAAAAANGYVEAQYELGSLYSRGDNALGVAPDAVESRRWLETAADQSHRRAIWEVAGRYEFGAQGFDLDLDKAKVLYRRFQGSVPESGSDEAISTESLFNPAERIAAIERLQTAVGNGEPSAMEELALRHLRAPQPAPGVQQRGLELFQRLAERGNADAQYRLGAIYIFGRHGVGKDLDQGSVWWRRAAGQRHLAAMERAADGYTNGNYGFEVDYRQAKSQIELLVRAYSDGLFGAPSDRLQASRWREALAHIDRAIDRVGGEYTPSRVLRGEVAQGKIQAHYRLARQLADESLRTHGGEVVELYAQAAAGGHAEAAMALFRLLQQGVSYTSSGQPGRTFTVIRRDHSEALRYLLRASELHHPQAMAELALAYQKARYGLTKDLVKARDILQQIVSAAESDLYGWQVDRSFVDTQRSRLDRSNRVLNNLKTRQQRYDQANPLERRIMDIEADYRKEYAGQVNAICVGHPACTAEHIKRRSKEIRRRLESLRDQRIAEATREAARDVR